MATAIATAEYDTIALEYKESKELPWRKYVETYSLFQITGSIEGMRVLDLACGEGFYTRKLKQARAATVLGVDISQEMIRLARRSERETPIGCQYRVNDIASLPDLGTFDLAVAMYLLNYAKSKSELLAFCKSIYRQLQPGGRFVGFNDNLMNDPQQYGSYRKYGFIKQCETNRQEGAPILYTFFNLDGSIFQFNNYYLHPRTYAEAFAEAGFTDFKWEAARLAPTQKGVCYWDHFMTHPPVIGFSAIKK